MKLKTHSEFQPRLILVPTDFSAPADNAVEAANEMAQLFGSAVFLLNVIPMLPIVAAPEYTVAYFPEEEFLADARRHATERLTASVAKLDAVGVRAQFGIEIGNDVVGNILMVAQREQADMMVLSTHGLSGWRPMVFGSIAEKVVKLAECPLLLLRAKKEAGLAKKVEHPELALAGAP